MPHLADNTHAFRLQAALSSAREQRSGKALKAGPQLLLAPLQQTLYEPESTAYTKINSHSSLQVLRLHAFQQNLQPKPC